MKICEAIVSPTGVLSSDSRWPLPANQRLFLRRGADEAELVLKPGTDVSFTKLTFRARPARPRGAVDNALRAGLFLAGFGPAYYRGYVDGHDMASTPPPARYEVGTDGTVSDVKALLTWQVMASPTDLSCGDALDYCLGLGPGWRLPSMLGARDVER